MTNLRYFFIIAVITFSLACGATAQLPPKDTQPAPVVSTEVSSIEMVVIADTGLNIRAEHSENSQDIGDLFPGDVVTCELPFTVVAESVWCKHERGWSNTHWMQAVK